MPRPVVTNIGLATSDAFPDAARDVGEAVAMQAFDYTTTVERDQGRRSDTWGQRERPNWQSIATVHCIVYSPTRPQAIEINGEPSSSSTTDRLHVLMPRSTDITANDRLGAIRDDTGRVMYEGPLSIIEPPAQRASFLDVMVRKIA